MTTPAETRRSPAELVEELLLELEAELLPRLQNEYGGQDLLAALRRKRALLQEHLKGARWKPGPSMVLVSTTSPRRTG